MKNILRILTRTLYWMRDFSNSLLIRYRIAAYNHSLPGKIPIVLSRTACLGSDLFALQYTKNDSPVLRINQQKTRVDVFMDTIESSARAHSAYINTFITRQDVAPLISQQEHLPWLLLHRPPQYMIMDSFAELTDKKFVHKKEGWAFCCHISDIEIGTPHFKSTFTIEGLLPINALEREYSRFFDWFESKYPDTTVYFIHFPTALDARPEYKARGQTILHVLHKLAYNRPYIRNVQIPESSVRSHEDDEFPYHYSAQTYQEFLKSWKFKGLN